jgi:hypothetical protein
LNNILVIYVWTHLPYTHDCIAICHYYMNALNIYIYIYIFCWNDFHFCFLSAFPIRSLKLSRVHVCNAKLHNQIVFLHLSIWTTLFNCVHLTIHNYGVKYTRNNLLSYD